MDAATVRIENSSRAHAESLQRLLIDYQPQLVEHEGAWQLEVPLGDLGFLLLKLFDSLGSWLDAEQFDSLLLHFDERQYTLLRPSAERLHGSNAFLLERVAQLETALNSRIVIEQAKGVLARALTINPEDAFDLLRQAARGSGTTLRTLAKSIAASPDQAEAILASPRTGPNPEAPSGV